MINDSINRYLGVLCYPFTSLDFFYEDKLKKFIGVRNSIKDDLTNRENLEKSIISLKKSIKEDVIHYIGRNYIVNSYDEINLYCEMCFLYSEQESNHDFYVNLFKALAQSFISQRDGKIVFKYWKNDKDNDLLGGFSGNNKIYLFHSLMRHVPLDFIVMTYMNVNGDDEQDMYCFNSYYGNIEVADQLLAKILQKGVAENHLHSGVSRTFLNIWDKLMEYTGGEDEHLYLMLPLDNHSLVSKTELQFYVSACRLIRACISIEIATNYGVLGNYKDSDNNENIELKFFVNMFKSGKELRVFYEQHFKDNPKEIDGYMKSLWEEVLEYIKWSEHRDCNLVRAIFKVDNTIKTYDEIIFLYYAMKHFLSEEKSLEQKCINELIVQYLRIKNFVFNTSVQQKTIKGLDYFQVEKYSKNSKLNRIKNTKFWEQAIRAQFQNTDLTKIEFRVSLHKNCSELRKMVKDFLQAYLQILRSDYCVTNHNNEYIVQRRMPKVGLVFHLLKRYDDSIPDKCIALGEVNHRKLQYGELQDNYIQEIENLIELRKENPELTKYLVGIDAASLENSTPIWTFTPVFEIARDSTVEPIGLSSYNNCFRQSLGFTFHAGEDFRHILSGLRRMDEVVTNLKFHAGDRIGHGTAIGIDPIQWRVSNPVVVMPRIEILDNYLWAYHILSHNYAKFEASILAYMEEVIYKTAKMIYGTTRGLTTAVLVDGYLNNFKASKLLDMCKEAEEQHFCKEQQEKRLIWDSTKLTFARHCKFYVSQMYYPVNYEITEEDIIIIQELQSIVRNNFSRLGIVIEINPSSNLVIGDLDIVTENHIYKISSIEKEKDNILTCVNSDDPTVFNTNVSNELAYIYYGMLERGIGKETALSWIDKLRKNGMDASFIQRNQTDQQIYDELERLVDSM
ncbi:hypothetical protein [Anaerosporobacter sp.]|uniref:hypothetical protein n=1 Tax=Anaerosporobacter sp. TaxID=1872529 RepID=UPI00286F1F28|nr:hypothetical protein [Anaerosporobacter sp.]